ncbi:MAG: Xaa-Pro dipeptidyl-peptidase [Planctomycetota bacterium]|nr:MAG: Xaa-Pro dipeptidyl-peptidase [Planctomycetota bacterium]
MFPRGGAAVRRDWRRLLLPVASTILVGLIFGPATSAGEKVTHRIENGQAEVVPEFNQPAQWIRHDLFVETEFDSDGDGKLDRMHVAVTRPQQTDTEGLRVPAIYVTSPYFGGTNPGGREYFWQVRHSLGVTPPPRKIPDPFEAKIDRPVISNSHIRDWVPRGFAVVHSSSPGTGLSQGCPTVGGDNESLAPKAVIDWLCGRATGYTEVDGGEEVSAYWCTGKVGMTGTSYNGTLPLAAATTGVEGLEAIIPIAPNTSYYHYYRSNGLVRHPGGWMGEDIDVLYDYIHSGNPDRRDWCDCHVREGEMQTHQDRVTGDYNDFWAGRDYLNDLAPMRCPMLMAHGFNDWNVVPEHSIRIYQAAKAKGLTVQLYMHQGGHGGPPPMEMMNRWFTRFLLGVDNGVEKDPKAWIVREGDKRTEPTPYADYPHPDARAVRLYPTHGGVQRGNLLPERPNQQGQETLVDNFSFNGATLAQAEWTEHRLLYAAPTLSQDLHLSGTVRVHVRLAADQPAVNLSVWLIALPWEQGSDTKITDNLITRGWADPQNAGDLRTSRPLVPGEFREFEFDLQPDDQVIPAGQQIALMVMSTDREFTLQPDPGARLTFDLDHTWIEVPIVGGMSAWRQAIEPAPSTNE